jgi:hypothetical protein
VILSHEPIHIAMAFSSKLFLEYSSIDETAIFFTGPISNLLTLKTEDIVKHAIYLVTLLASDLLPEFLFYIDVIRLMPCILGNKKTYNTLDFILPLRQDIRTIIAEHQYTYTHTTIEDPLKWFKEVALFMYEPSIIHYLFTVDTPTPKMHYGRKIVKKVRFIVNSP